MYSYCAGMKTEISIVSGLRVAPSLVAYLEHFIPLCSLHEKMLYTREVRQNTFGRFHEKEAETDLDFGLRMPILAHCMVCKSVK